MPDEGYAAPGRLQDVLALIQVLAFAPGYRRTEVQLRAALMSESASGASRWSDVASRHPEFFRVWGQNRDQVALAAGHMAGQDEATPGLPPDPVQHPMRTAVDIHDRELRRRGRWSNVPPLAIAVVGAVGSVLTTLVGLWASRRSRSAGDSSAAIRSARPFRRG